MQKLIFFAVLIGLVGTFGYIAYTIAIPSTEPRPDNYRAAVVRVLNVRRVDYRDVEVLDSCAPSYQNCQTYAAMVRALDATTMIGQIECRERWTTCTLTIPQAGISGAILDDEMSAIQLQRAGKRSTEGFCCDFERSIAEWAESALARSSHPRLVQLVRGPQPQQREYHTQPKRTNVAHIRHQPAAQHW
jgi:hypothetical protein